MHRRPASDSSIFEICTLTCTWSRSISQAWVKCSFQLPGKWTRADCILDSGLGFPGDLLKTIVSYFGWTAGSWVERDQLSFSCRQSFWMCWLLKPLLAGRSYTSRTRRTRLAGRKSQPYLLLTIQELTSTFLAPCKWVLHYLMCAWIWEMGWVKGFLSLSLKHLTGVYVLSVGLSECIICKSWHKWWHTAQNPTL